uniref:Uncharacterized protein n=1 Tax=Vitis vinifera TaxID=29760 RepID=F6H4C3_VITVI
MRFLILRSYNATAFCVFAHGGELFYSLIEV